LISDYDPTNKQPSSGTAAHFELESRTMMEISAKCTSLTFILLSIQLFCHKTTNACEGDEKEDASNGKKKRKVIF
jgi:hypothetical protein